jgi:hypothetical protein
MKVTKAQLQKLIKDELATMLKEDYNINERPADDPQDSKEACDKAGGVWTEGADHPCNLTGMPQRPTVTESKKITKSKLKQLIREELEDALTSEAVGAGFAKLGAKGLAALTGKGNVPDYIQQMEGDIRSNTDDIQEIFRVLKEKGIYVPGI